MRVGEEKKVVVSPEDGYGTANASSRLEVPKAEIPPEAQRVGARLMARTAEGQERPVQVAEVRETTVVLDLNHPLAGKTLLFEVRVLGIDPPGSPVPRRLGSPSLRPDRPRCSRDSAAWTERISAGPPIDASDHAAGGGRGAGLLPPMRAPGRSVPRAKRPDVAYVQSRPCETSQLEISANMAAWASEPSTIPRISARPPQGPRRDA